MSFYTYGDRLLWEIRSSETGITVEIRREVSSALRRTLNRLLKRTEAVDEGTLQIPWTRIQRIVAFKRDQFTVDLICFALDLSNGDVVELDEHMQGWSILEDEVAQRLPRFMRDWRRTAVTTTVADTR